MSPRHIRTTAVFRNVVSPGPFVFPYRYNTTPIVIELSPSGINQNLPKKKKKFDFPKWKAFLYKYNNWIWKREKLFCIQNQITTVI